MPHVVRLWLYRIQPNDAKTMPRTYVQCDGGGLWTIRSEGLEVFWMHCHVDPPPPCSELDKYFPTNRPFRWYKITPLLPGDVFSTGHARYQTQFKFQQVLRMLITRIRLLSAQLSQKPYGLSSATPWFQPCLTVLVTWLQPRYIINRCETDRSHGQQKKTNKITVPNSSKS